MAKLKIFIGGIAGFLGSHLAEGLIKKGYSVAGCDNLIGGDLSNLTKGVRFYNVDCNDFDKLKEIFENEKPDIVYALQATPHEGLSVFSPAIVNLNTYQSVITLLSVAINNKVKRFIFTSSMARYGHNITPYTEDMSPRPVDPYGFSKVFAEEQIKLLCKIHNMEYVIAVPHNIIGPKQKHDDPFRNVVSIFINRMLQNKSPIIYGDGNQMRCFSFINDCIDSLIKMSTADINREIINIGPDEEFVTINDLANMIAKKLRFKKDFIYVKDRPQEVKIAICSSDKARRLLSYKTKTTLSDGIDTMIDSIRKDIKDFDYYLPLEIINDKIPNTWRDQLI